MILEEKNTLFDSLIKNLENNKELYDYIEDIIVRGNDKVSNNYHSANWSRKHIWLFYKLMGK